MVAAFDNKISTNPDIILLQVYNLADKKSNKHVEVFGYDGTG